MKYTQCKTFFKLPRNIIQEVIFSLDMYSKLNLTKIFKIIYYLFFINKQLIKYVGD